MSVVNLIKPLDQHVVNVLSVYARADLKDITDGIDAYVKYNETMHRIARKYVGDDEPMVEKVCAVFAALSPNATYASNLSSTEAVLKAWANNKPIESVKVSTYGKNKLKAWNILNYVQAYTSNGDWTTGKKTYAFYRNIYGPGDPSAPVVVDGHMYSVWMLERFGMSEAQVGNGRRYDRISDDIKTAARIAGVTGSEMQAVCYLEADKPDQLRYAGVAAQVVD
jgi:hypothetical protein